MNEIKYDLIKKYCPEFGEVRTITDENGIIWYCATDILDILGYTKNGWYATLSKYCRYLTKYKVPHPQSDTKTISMNFITREDVFNLLDHSQMPKAAEFRHWLFGDALPTIEATGMYILPEATVELEEIKENPEEFFKRYQEMIAKIAQNNKKIEDLASKNNELKEENEGLRNDNEFIRSQRKVVVDRNKAMKHQVELYRELLNSSSSPVPKDFIDLFDKLFNTMLNNLNQEIKPQPLIRFMDDKED